MIIGVVLGTSETICCTCFVWSIYFSFIPTEMTLTLPSFTPVLNLHTMSCARCAAPLLVTWLIQPWQRTLTSSTNSDAPRANASGTTTAVLIMEVWLAASTAAAAT